MTNPNNSVIIVRMNVTVNRVCYTVNDSDMYSVLQEDAEVFDIDAQCFDLLEHVCATGGDTNTGHHITVLNKMMVWLEHNLDLFPETIEKGDKSYQRHDHNFKVDRINERLIINMRYVSPGESQDVIDLSMATYAMN